MVISEHFSYLELASVTNPIPTTYFLFYIYIFHYLNQLFNEGNSALAVSR